MEEGSVKSASDFSYSAPSYAGRGYRIIGDAGGAYLTARVVLLWLSLNPRVLLSTIFSFHRPILLLGHPPRPDIRPLGCFYDMRVYPRGLL